MSVSAIQEASRRIRDFENEELEGQGSRAWGLYDTLVRLRSESLELFSAMAAVMFDEEIGNKAREIVERSRTGKVTRVASSFIREQTGVDAEQAHPVAS